MNGVGTMGFGDELAELRAKRGVSWEELARRSQVSASYLKDIAQGRRGQGWPGEPVVEAVAAALDVDPDFFLLTRARAVLRSREAVDAAYGLVLRG